MIFSYRENFYTKVQPMIFRKSFAFLLLFTMTLTVHGKDNSSSINNAPLPESTLSKRAIPKLTSTNDEEFFAEAKSSQQLIQKEPLWKTWAQTVGRYKKPILLGTMVGISVGGVIYYYLSLPTCNAQPFNAQSFLSSYDSSQTGLGYSSFSYEGQPFPTFPNNIIQPSSCVNGSNLLQWRGAQFRGWKGDENPGFESPCLHEGMVPYYNVMNHDHARPMPVCNKTLSDAVDLLSQQCGFSFNYLKSFFESNVDRVFRWHEGDMEDKSYYCNPDPLNQKLVCSNLLVGNQMVEAYHISEIKVAGVANYFNGIQRVKYNQCMMSLCEGIVNTGLMFTAITLCSFGMMLWG